jgi:hypothetical protein
MFTSRRAGCEALRLSESSLYEIFDARHQPDGVFLVDNVR